MLSLCWGGGGGGGEGGVIFNYFPSLRGNEMVL